MTDDSGNSFSSHAGKVKILKSHSAKLGTELDVKSFDDSWKDDVSNLVKYFEARSFRDSPSNGVLDQPITLAEVSHVVKAIKSNKSAGSDSIVVELMKYGSKPMLEMMLALFKLVWDSEYAPSNWRESLIVSLFKKRDREDPGNYRGITLLNVVGKLYSRVINNRQLKRLELNHLLHEGQGGFRMGRSCIDNIFSLNELTQGRIREGRSTFAFFLMLRKPMTPYGGMGCVTKCGKWVSKVSCGGWLGLYMQIIEAVSFWKVSILNFFQLIRVLPRVAHCRPLCF